MKKLATYLIFIIVLILGIGKMTFAGTGAGIVVYPNRIELKADRGETIETTITVFNSSDLKADIGLGVWNFAWDKKGRPVAIGKRDAEYFRSLAGWVSVPYGNQTLEPKARLRVPLKIKVPKRISDGSYYAYFRVKILPTDRPKHGIITEFKLNHLLLLRVGGSSGDRVVLERDLKPLNLSVNRYNFGPKIKFQAILKNNGNIHEAIESQFVINDYRGRLVKKINVPEQTVLPKNKTFVFSSWDGAPLIGKYTLNFKGTIADLKDLKMSADFWVISPAFVVALLLGIVLFILSFIYIKRNFRIQRKPA